MAGSGPYALRCSSPDRSDQATLQKTAPATPRRASPSPGHPRALPSPPVFPRTSHVTGAHRSAGMPFSSPPQPVPERQPLWWQVRGTTRHPILLVFLILRHILQAIVPAARHVSSPSSSFRHILSLLSASQAIAAAYWAVFASLCSVLSRSGRSEQSHPSLARRSPAYNPSDTSPPALTPPRL